MTFSSGLALKVLGGLAVVSVGTTGIYFSNDYFSNRLSKYDNALISFLNDDLKNDIVFEIKKGSSESSVQDLNNSDLNWPSEDSTPKTAIIKATLQTTNPQTNLKKSGSGITNISDVQHFKSLGNSQTWTWECIIEFIRSTGSSSSTLKDKDSVFKSENQGLFGILKKDYSNSSETGSGDKFSRQEIREIKTKFIQNCGARGLEKNRNLNKNSLDENNKLTKKISFNLEDKNNQLEPIEADKMIFYDWFKQEYGTKQS